MPFAQIYNMAKTGSERTDRGDFLPGRPLSHPNPPPILFPFFWIAGEYAVALRVRGVHISTHRNSRDLQQP
jgi:hypothetical protein